MTEWLLASGLSGIRSNSRTADRSKGAADEYARGTGEHGYNAGGKMQQQNKGKNDTNWCILRSTARSINIQIKVTYIIFEAHSTTVSYMDVTPVQNIVYKKMALKNFYLRL